MSPCATWPARCPTPARCGSSRSTGGQVPGDALTSSAPSFTPCSDSYRRCSEHLVRARPGTRPGTHTRCALVDDFVVERDGPLLHVLNAIPAATAASRSRKRSSGSTSFQAKRRPARWDRQRRGAPFRTPDRTAPPSHARACRPRPLPQSRATHSLFLLLLEGRDLPGHQVARTDRRPQRGGRPSGRPCHSGQDHRRMTAPPGQAERSPTSSLRIRTQPRLTSPPTPSGSFVPWIP